MADFYEYKAVLLGNEKFMKSQRVTIPMYSREILIFFAWTNRWGLTQNINVGFATFWCHSSSKNELHADIYISDKAHRSMSPQESSDFSDIQKNGFLLPELSVPASLFSFCEIQFLLFKETKNVNPDFIDGVSPLSRYLTSLVYRNRDEDTRVSEAEPCCTCDAWTIWKHPTGCKCDWSAWNQRRKAKK